MQRLTKEAFADALAKGKGRAFLHLQSYSDDGVEDVLRDACVRDVAYDTQCEGDRGAWMMELIAHGRSPQLYHQAILEAIAQPCGYRTADQLGVMLGALAEAGNADAKAALYRRFDEHNQHEDHSLGEQLIALDGIDGLLHVAQSTGARLLRSSEERTHNYLIEIAADRCGSDATVAALEQASQHNENVRAYIAGVISESGALLPDNAPRPPPVKPEPPTLASILSAVDSAVSRAQLRVMARRLLPETGARLFEHLAAERDPGRLYRLMQLFLRTALPSIPEQVIAAAESEDEKMHAAAIDCLSATKHPQVDALAYRLLDAGRTRALRLLVNGHDSTDFIRLQRYLIAGPDAEVIHDMAGSVLDICGSEPKEAAASALAWVYEHSPCAICRYKAARGLDSIGHLTEEWKDECLHDCYDDTRQFAAGLQPR